MIECVCRNFGGEVYLLYDYINFFVLVNEMVV